MTYIIYMLRHLNIKSCEIQKRLVYYYFIVIFFCLLPFDIVELSHMKRACPALKHV